MELINEFIETNYIEIWSREQTKIKGLTWTPLIQKLQNQITSYITSFQYFIHLPGVASTGRNRVLINKMCLWIYCFGIAGHLWWITRVSSMRFNCSGCARTLHFNRSNKWSIWFKSRLLAGHLSFVHCSQLASVPRDVMRNPMPTSYLYWHGYEEEEPTEWRHFDTYSQLCFLEWLRLEFSCAWTRLCAFCYAHVRHI